MKFTALYIAAIVAINYGFSIVPLLPTPWGDMWPPMSLLVGFVFIFRDFAQREIGHKVILAMLLGGVISYVMADPYVAIASVVAFLVSESIDWAVYSYTRRPLRDRILISSLFAAPIDTVVFLGMVGFLTTTGAVLMTVSKLLGAFAVYYWMRQKRVMRYD